MSGKRIEDPVPHVDVLASTISPKRVMHVFGRMNRGGAEIRTLEIMRAIDRQQFLLEYCALSGESGDLDEEIVSLGGRVHYCKIGFSFPIQFIRLLRQQKVDVVHSHVLFVSGIILLLARLGGVPIRIAHFRTTGHTVEQSPLRTLRDRLLRLLLNANATKILAVSRGAMVACWGSDWSKDVRCVVIYNSVDPKVFAQNPDRLGIRTEFELPPNARIVIHVGRMDPSKNHEKLMSVFAEVARLTPDTYLLLVGKPEPTLQVQLANFVARNALENRVRFAGLRSDVPRLLLGADLLLFPSRWEGLPGAVLEAVAANLPVLAADIAVIREIAAECETVHLCQLSTPDSVWAESAVRIMSASGAAGRRAEMFTGSAFDPEFVRQAYVEAWS